jgi:glycosyltransferase 2 family protein
VRWFKALSLVLGVAAVALLIRTGVSGWSELRNSNTKPHVGWLAGAGVFAAAAMTWIAISWRTVMRMCGCELPLTPTVGAYYLGEIGKYVPGAIWPVVGRGELARQQRHARGLGAGREAIYESVLLSLIYLFLAGLVVAFAGIATSGFEGGWPLLLLLLLPTGIGALHPSVSRPLLAAATKITRGKLKAPTLPTWSISVQMIMRYIPAWLFVVGSSWCASKAIGLSVPFSLLIGATCLGWVAGFVFIPAPGGLGPRELVFALLLGTNIRPGQAALFAVATRVSFVVVDAAGAAAGAFVLRKPRRQTVPNSPS